jgi:G3E family GTPase
MIAKSGVDGEDIAGKAHPSTASSPLLSLCPSSGFFELSNGCICCTVKEDLLATLEQLVLHKDRFDYVLIETTGVANPGPIIASLWADDDVDSTLKLDGVVTVVDCLNVLQYLSTPGSRSSDPLSRSPSSMLPLFSSIARDRGRCSNADCLC